MSDRCKSDENRNELNEMSSSSDVEDLSIVTSDEPDQIQIRGQIFHIAGPAIFEMVLQTMTQIVDMVMVGQLGPAAIAAVGIANQPTFFLMALFQALAVGTTALVARLIGARKRNEASEVMKQSVGLAVVFGGLIGGVFVILAPHVIQFMGADADVAPMATDYFRIIVSGMIFTALTVIMVAGLRGAGDARTPMVARSVANVLNVVLNWLLIFGVWFFPQLGVLGAGVSTITTRALSVLMIAYVMRQGKTPLKWDGSIIPRWNMRIIHRILNVGLPAAGEQFILRSGQMLFVRTVASMGTLAMAAHQIALNIESLSFMPGFGFSVASTALVGQHLGAKKPGWAETAGFETAKVAVMTMGCIAVGLFIFGPSVIHLYTDDPQVIELGTTILRIIAVVQPAIALSFTMGGGLRGAGDTRFVLVASGISIWAVRLVLAHYLGVVMGLGLVGAWLGMSIDLCFRAVLVTIRFRGGRWKSIKV